jgi:hypothetical protein
MDQVRAGGDSVMHAERLGTRRTGTFAAPLQSGPAPLKTAGA